MDATDLKILEQLQADGRISIVDLANRVNLTPTPCARRVQNLERDGVITDYVGLVDQEKAGLAINAFVFVTLRRESTDEPDLFQTVVAGRPEVMECYLLTGGHDYLLRIVAQDLNSLHEFLDGQLESMSCVESVHTSLAHDRIIYRTQVPLDQLRTRRPD